MHHMVVRGDREYVDDLRVAVVAGKSHRPAPLEISYQAGSRYSALEDALLEVEVDFTRMVRR